MKLHLADAKDRTSITGYGAGYVSVNGVACRTPCLVTPDRPVQPWPVASFDTLTVDAVQALLQEGPEIVIFGTGPTQRFPSPELLRPLIEARVGLEIMATPAACRTYNILMNEARRVLAAMWLP